MWCARPCLCPSCRSRPRTDQTSTYRCWPRRRISIFLSHPEWTITRSLAFDRICLSSERRPDQTRRSRACTSIGILIQNVFGRKLDWTWIRKDVSKLLLCFFNELRTSILMEVSNSDLSYCHSVHVSLGFVNLKHFIASVLFCIETALKKWIRRIVCKNQIICKKF